MKRFLMLLKRGLTFRCPVCGTGHLFQRPFVMNERCSSCSFQFEREEGYYTGSMAINLVISELVVISFTLPLAYNPTIPILPVILIGSTCAILLPFILFHHSRALWLSMDHFLNPVDMRELPNSQAVLRPPNKL
ncbi:MAG TPA: DUF983 domain-containing protein [Dictyobacter sp.]|jgi:uncharacterized protein (DUF983 family)|nr:DUF983 domain-containing protein [Dictyobacter sp.]